MQARPTDEPPVAVYGDESGGYTMVVGETPERRVYTPDSAQDTVRIYNSEVKQRDDRAVIGSDDRERLYSRWHEPGNAMYDNGAWAIDVHALATYSFPAYLEQETVDPDAFLEPVSADEIAADQSLGVMFPADQRMDYTDLRGLNLSASRTDDNTYVVQRSEEPRDTAHLQDNIYVYRIDTKRITALQDDLIAAAAERMPETIAAAATQAVCNTIRSEEGLLQRLRHDGLTALIRGDTREDRTYAFYEDLVTD